MRFLLPCLALVAACHGGSGSDSDSDSTDTTDPTDTDTNTAVTGDTGEATLWVEQAFLAPESKAEDIVFVVDNSCSMSDNQRDLASTMEGFVATLDGGGIDWRVGVTSTDVDGNYGNPLEGRLVQDNGTVGVSAGTPDAATLIREQLQLGVDGSGEEKGILAVYMALGLHGDGANASFFRDHAGFHVVVVSDEDDQSDASRPELITLPEFVNWMVGVRPNTSSVSFSSLVCTEETIACSSLGTRYMEVSESIGGIVADIHQPLEPVTLAIAAAVVAGSGLRSLVLDEVPADPDTLEVLVDGVLLDPAEWSFDETSNTVVLVDAAPDGAEVVVRFPA